MAEKCVREYRDEKKKIKPYGGAVTAAELAVIIASLNRRIRNRGLSAREILTRRDQISNKVIKLDDEVLASQQLQLREENHPSSARSKAGSDKLAAEACVWPGALVILKKDLTKLRTRETYIVVKMDENAHFCWIKKLESQCRSKNYKVSLNEIELVANQQQGVDESDQEGFEADEEDIDEDDTNEEPNDTKKPLKERTVSKYSLRQKKRPDYKLMDQGPLLNAINFEDVPPKYGWDTLGETSSDDNGEISATVKVCVTANSEDLLSPVRSTDWDDEVIVPLRRSKRAKKRYPYRGIEDFVSWNETDVEKDNQTDEVFNEIDRRNFCPVHLHCLHGGCLERCVQRLQEELHD